MLKKLIIVLFFFNLIILKAYSQFSEKDTVFDNRSILGKPFGTILKLKVKVIECKRFACVNKFKLRILKINGEVVTDSISLPYNDYSGNIPLIERGNKESIIKREKYKNRLEFVELEKLEGGILGKEYDVIAYETGEFVGIPDKAFDYIGTMQCTGFYFKNSLIVLSIKIIE